MSGPANVNADHPPFPSSSQPIYHQTVHHPFQYSQPIQQGPPHPYPGTSMPPAQPNWQQFAVVKPQYPPVYSYPTQTYYNHNVTQYIAPQSYPQQQQFQEIPFASFSLHANVHVSQSTPVPFVYRSDPPPPPQPYIYPRPMPTPTPFVPAPIPLPQPEPVQPSFSAVSQTPVFDSPSSENAFQSKHSRSTRQQQSAVANPPFAKTAASTDPDEDADEDEEDDIVGFGSGSRVIQPLDPQTTAATKQAYMNRPNVCELCGKRFQKVKHLKRHLEVHSESKKFECSDCGKKFRRRDNLVSHSRIHTGETPYACPICDKKFRHQSACINHRRTHYDTKNFQCHLCLLSFSRKSSLKRHIQGIHRSQSEQPLAQSSNAKNGAAAAKTGTEDHTSPHGSDKSEDSAEQ
eukprot:TRINITY_DN57050_c0_g1_i1.p1 TRINITY_DN57050_c0_g1~~TRINITY_DN57050_c0_g1_i1.p1  ORF type:complete len:403 (-),score=54.20 TRINITY_DN57050_c0_g1_i1:107-1315(-)